MIFINFNLVNKKNIVFFKTKILLANKMPLLNNINIIDSFDLKTVKKVFNNKNWYINFIEINPSLILNSNNYQIHPISLVYITHQPLYMETKLSIIQWLIQYSFFKLIISNIKDRKFIIFKYNWESELEKNFFANFINKKFYVSQTADKQIIDINYIINWFKKEKNQNNLLLVKFFKIVWSNSIFDEWITVYFNTNRCLFVDLLFLPDLFSENSISLIESIKFLKKNKIMKIYEDLNTIQKIPEKENKEYEWFNKTLTFCYTGHLKNISSSKNLYCIKDNNCTLILNQKLIKPPFNEVKYLVYDFNQLNTLIASLKDNPSNHLFYMLDLVLLEKNWNYFNVLFGILIALNFKQIDIILENEFIVNKKYEEINKKLKNFVQQFKDVVVNILPN